MGHASLSQQVGSWVAEVPRPEVFAPCGRFVTIRSSLVISFLEALHASEAWGASKPLLKIS
jgi:hypothetical protein